MCGVAAIAAPYASAAWRKAIMSKLLNGCKSRGTDATGIAFIDPSDGMKVLKNGVSADKFIRQEDYDTLSANLAPIVIGHCRAATGGQDASATNNNNNHPFIGKKTGLAMVHNGILSDDKWRKTVGMPDGISENYPFEGGCDSELWLRMLETMLGDQNLDKDNSMETCISDAAANIQGSYALLMIKADQPNKLWCVKHNNPIVLGYNPKERFIIAASTDDIIKEALTDYRYLLDYFIQEIEPSNLVLDDQIESSIVTIEVLPDKPYFNVTSQAFEPATSEYSRHWHGHGAAD